MSNSQNSKDLQQGQDAPQAQPDHTEHNKAKENAQLTQTNEPRRTPESRIDRESHVGSGNQTQSREGGH
jgi:hypothetical protein